MGSFTLFVHLKLHFIVHCFGTVQCDIFIKCYIIPILKLLEFTVDLEITYISLMNRLLHLVVL